MDFSLDKKVGGAIYHFHVVRTAFIKKEIRKITANHEIIKVEIALLSALAFYLDDQNISHEILLKSEINVEYMMLGDILFEKEHIHFKTTLPVVILPERKIKQNHSASRLSHFANIIVKPS